MNSSDSYAVKLLPLSDLGMPNLANTSSRALQVIAASILGKGMASIYLVAKSIMVKIYAFPFFVLSNLPTISMAILDHGVSITGRGHRGSFLVFLLLNLWQILHALQYCTTSPGHQK